MGWISRLMRVTISKSIFIFYKTCINISVPDNLLGGIDQPIKNATQNLKTVKEKRRKARLNARSQSHHALIRFPTPAIRAPLALNPKSINALHLFRIN